MVLTSTLLCNTPFFRCLNHKHATILAQVLIPYNALLHSEIKNEADFQHQLEEVSNDMLVIVDCHQSWCGPCQPIIPWYNQLWIEIDEPGKRIKPCTLDVCTPNMDKVIQKLVGKEIDVAKQGCQVFSVLNESYSF